MKTTKNTSATMTTKQAAEYLNLSRVRVLGLAKQGKLVATKGEIAGTSIPQVLFSRESVENYVPTRSGGQRAMVVKLPTEELDELKAICQERGWTIRAKNEKREKVVEASYDGDEEELFEDETDEVEEPAEVEA